MSKEFGIYPANRKPLMWAGARGIYKPFDKWRVLDIPFDRWSSEFQITDNKNDFIDWINDFALPQVEKFIKNRCIIKQYFESDDGCFYCEFDERSSGGYMYLGFGTTEKYESLKENRN